jgi:phosphoribosylanthranilate isomerase
VSAVTRIKICGLTRVDDVAAAVAAGAWAVGFVLWPGSPRAVTPEQVRRLTDGVPKHVRRVGVTVNASVEEVLRWRDAAGLTTIQLHGDEDPAPFLAAGLDLIKAVSLQDEADVLRAAALPPEVQVLVDAHDPTRRGGTGERADWTLARTLAGQRPVLLAGGLRPGNVPEAIRVVAPWGIDVSSGVERAPGIKDHEAITALFTTTRAGVCSHSV